MKFVKARGPPELALQSQHMFTAPFHFGNPKMLAWNSQSPRIWHKHPRRPPARYSLRGGKRRPSQSNSGHTPPSMTLNDQLKISKMVFNVSGITSLFLIMVINHLFDIVVPTPQKRVPCQHEERICSGERPGVSM